MQKAKKLIGLVLVLCVAITMVAGCGSEASDSTSTASASSSVVSTDSSAAPSSTAIDTSKAVDLQWYVIGNGQPKDMDAVLTKVNDYIKPIINASVKINFFTWGDDYKDKMAAKVTSGEKFDIAFTSSWALDYYSNATKGAFVDLTPMMDTYAPKTKAALGENIIKGASIDGKLYAIPAKKEMAHNWGFLINKTMADKNGIDISTIKTFKDLEPALKVIKEKEKGVEGFQTLVGESAYRVLDFEKMSGDDVPGAIYGDGRDTKVINDFDTPEAKDLFTTLNSWYKAGYIRKDADTVTDFSSARKAGKVFSCLASLKPGKDKEQSVSDNTNWVQVDLTGPVQTTREMTGSMQAISKSSENKERALMFLELFNSDVTLNNLINFGIEGTHYKKVDGKDNIIEATEAGAANYQPNGQWMFGNQFLAYLYKTEDPEKMTKFEAYNSAAKVSPILGFTFNNEPVKTKIAALTGIKKQYMPGLETGKTPVETALPKFTEKLKAAGLDEVLKEMQSQVDAFLKK